jgi:gluconolactonase
MNDGSRMSWDVRRPAFVDVAGDDQNVEQIGTGFGFTEGPVWDARVGRLVFSDMKHDHMRSWTAPGGIETFRKPCQKANGNALDREGRLLSCEHSTSRVVRQERDGSLTILASHYDGRELNSPNDIIVASDGGIYFTDPTYGRIREELGVLRDPVLAFRGVYRIPPDRKDLQLLVDDFEQPNGLCFSIDETKLYVNDAVRGHIRVFDVSGDGTVKNGRIWATLVGEGVGVADGMKTDGQGHIYCTGPGGIHVFRPDAECLGVIRLSERPANFAWGGGDFRTLFVTATTSLYRLRTRVPGHRIGVNAIP